MDGASPWAPLNTPLYRALWIALLASNIGSWTQGSGAGWMMTSLSTDPLMVALVPGAGSLPMFLFGLPAGVLSDIVDRRRYLIVAQCWMLLVAAALGARAAAGLVTPSLLLVDHLPARRGWRDGSAAVPGHHSQAGADGRAGGIVSDAFLTALNYFAAREWSGGERTELPHFSRFYGGWCSLPSLR